MRRAALGLLGALLLYNPFGAQLPEPAFAASLAEYRAKLQARGCPHASPEIPAVLTCAPGEH